jgi:hypothetical protein
MIETWRRIMTIDSNTQVIRFPSRNAPPLRELSCRWASASPAPAAEDETRNNAAEDDEEYRYRMRANCLSAIAIIALLVIGEWVLNGLVSAERGGHGCIRAGGSECGTIEMPFAPPQVGRWS